MGVWGTNLYQDDVACDVRDEYLDWLRVGYSNADATNTIIENNMDFIEDEEDGPIFWFALADTQWRYGRLFDEIKEVALEYINSEVDLKRWEDDPKDYRKRKKVLEDLATKLNSPQPPERKVGKIVVRKAPWNVGDILLYKIKDEYLEGDYKNNKLVGRYVLLKVIGIVKTKKNSLPHEYDNEACAVLLYNWDGDYIPSKEEVKKMKLFPFVERRNIVLSYSRNDLKKLDFKVIGNDNEFKTCEEYTSALGTWPFIRVIDTVLIDNIEDNRKILHNQ